MFFSFLKKFSKKKENINPEDIRPVYTDIHSHILPGIDDGAKDVDESIKMIREFVDMDYKKLIMTPHIMMDVYKNTPEIIKEKLVLLQEKVKEENINIDLDIAAEYYLDEGFLQKLNNEEPLLTFGDNYLLFETSYMNPSILMNEAVFLMQSQGYKPVLAHPERYTYLSNKYEELVELREKGVYLQLNILSLTGYYSAVSQKMAERLIDDKLISFIGSDCHKPKHAQRMSENQTEYYLKKALTLDLLNNTL